MLKPFWAIGSITRDAAVGIYKVLCHKTLFRDKAFISAERVNIWNALLMQHKIDNNLANLTTKWNTF